MTIQVRSNEAPAPETKSAPKAAEGKEQESSDVNASAQVSSDTEQNESETSESSETEENGSGETESDEREESDEESETEGSTEDEAPKAQNPKKKGGFQRRIDKLNAAKTAAQQEAEYWKRVALEKQAAGASKNDAPKVDAQSTANDSKPKPDDFETHAAYVEALTDWKVDQRDKTRDAEAQKSRIQSEQQKAVQTYQERVKAFEKEHGDFQEVLSEVDGIRVSPAVSQIILESENGPRLAYELAKDPGEFERICKLPPLACAREMGKLEARIASKTSSEAKQKPETKKITQAPKPLEPVKAGGKGSTGKSIFDPNLSQAEYERLRREQINKRRQA